MTKKKIEGMADLVEDDDGRILKIEFSPGCFDQFEGTQEELDELVAEVQKMFEGKTHEEIRANSREITEEDWEELPESAKMQIARSVISLDDEEDDEDYKRKLQ